VGDAGEAGPGASGEPLGVGRTAEVFGWGEGQVVKLARAGIDPRAVDGEWLATVLAAAAGLAVPRPLARVEIGGRLGIVLERRDGPTMLAALSRRPWRIGREAARLGELSAEVHAVSGAGLPSLREVTAARIEAGLGGDARRRALAELAALDDGDRLCHGDLHPDNVMLTKRGPALIDWEGATSGNPLADAARTAVLLTVAEIPVGTPLRMLLVTARRRFAEAWRRAYAAAHPHRPEDLEAWIPVVAAARLSEGIEAERHALRRIVERRFVSGS